MGRLLRYFLEGLFYTVPVFVTIYVVYALFMKIDRLFRFDVPGIGVLLTFVLITFVGFLGTNYLSKKAMQVIDHVFTKVPFIKMIYTAIKDLTGAFVSNKKRFDKPVAVRLAPDSSLRMLGFMTSEDLQSFGLKEHVAVYAPQAYNFAGHLLVVERSQVTPLDADSGDLMAFIVSGGVSMKEGAED